MRAIIFDVCTADLTVAHHGEATRADMVRILLRRAYEEGSLKPLAEQALFKVIEKEKGKKKFKWQEYLPCARTINRIGVNHSHEKDLAKVGIYITERLGKGFREVVETLLNTERPLPRDYAAQIPS